MLEYLTQGILVVPRHARGLIVFSHGSGSGHLSPRNMFVAERLQQAGFATYLFDLLSEEEDRNPDRRFDISLLASRLTQTVRWVSARAECLHLPVGLFGASTGSAAAMLASLSLSQVKAIVSRGGRPDLVLDNAPSVRVPTLLIVGGEDHEVLKLNQQFFTLLSSIKKLSIYQTPLICLKKRVLWNKWRIWQRIGSPAICVSTNVLFLFLMVFLTAYGIIL